MATESLPVIFRKEKHENDGEYDIVAIFPTLPGSSAYNFSAYVPTASGWSFPDGYTFSTAVFEWYWKTRPSAPEEYAPLLQYLQTVEGFEHLKIYRRFVAQFDDAREDEIARIEIPYELDDFETYYYAPFELGSKYLVARSGENGYELLDPYTQAPEHYSDSTAVLKAMSDIGPLRNWKRMNE